jgi:nitrite reductase (NO-forming)
MQTVPFGASNGGVVEFIAPEPGTYIMVDHEFADAQRGAVGYIEVRTPDGRMTSNLPPMTH